MISDGFVFLVLMYSFSTVWRRRRVTPQGFSRLLSEDYNQSHYSLGGTSLQLLS
jgi:hypothetical protein